MVSLLLNLLWVALAGAKCYEPSVAHPLPEYDPKHPLLRNAFAAINSALTIQVAAPEYANTSFSVEITSSKESLWSMHHTARERNSSRPDIPKVNGDALYRIASITKSFTVLGILYQHVAGNLSLDDPITNYIEGLKDEQKGSIPWEDITLRSLASQLSGIPREFAQGDLLNADKWDIPNVLAFGLPPVSSDGLPKCDEYSPNYEIPCTPDDLLKVATSKDPIFAPNQRSTYSNVAFELLGIALANVTNQTYESYIEEAIFKPLDMAKSTLSLPPDSAGVIPLNPQYWDVDEGVQNPTGGIYSSSTDLSKYLRYILKHYNGITHAANWVHPVSPSGGLHSFYGMPWEIFQTDRILQNSQRTVRFITKGGGLPGYTSVIMTIPEYDLGITILVAGPTNFFPKIQDVVTVQIVRAAEELAIQLLQERYTGTYVSIDPQINSSITLVADHRGLVVNEFISNSTDVLKTDFMSAVGAPRDGGSWYAQLIPTLLYRDEEAERGELWRVIGTAERSGGEHTVWDDFCVTDIDHPLYAGLPANELVFLDRNGETFQTLELTGFRVILSRIIKNSDDWTHEDQEIVEL